jgi:hypothetical protein
MLHMRRETLRNKTDGWRFDTIFPPGAAALERDTIALVTVMRDQQWFDDHGGDPNWFAGHRAVPQTLSEEPANRADGSGKVLCSLLV